MQQARFPQSSKFTGRRNTDSRASYRKPHMRGGRSEVASAPPGVHGPPGCLGASSGDSADDVGHTPLKGLYGTGPSKLLSNGTCQPATPTGAAGPRGPTSVVVRGLPNTLCNQPCMEVALEQAGIAGSVLKCEAHTGWPCGEAVVVLSTWEAANRCIRHFAGCKWAAGGQVTAMISGTSHSAPGAWCVDKQSMPANQQGEPPMTSNPMCRDESARFKAPAAIGVPLITCAPPPPVPAPTMPPPSFLAGGTLGAFYVGKAPPEIYASPATSTPPSPMAASTAAPPTPSIEFGPTGTFHTRKVSWADLASDDEEEDFSTHHGTTEEEGGSQDYGFCPSDDGF
eukprot:CAMPEP_0170571066 /NCGR_PEP_ID=MMETSP0224-20130122/1460_1 /TAXON_ID=285029 /ORGANISM="Togula jolla, Strain CCCM 725" /LENGTH=339 /DNA_ID=CAMNT_0010893415 /DNA_START=80 /DNA_END=1099 /DNA_ORIENTATION=+